MTRDPVWQRWISQLDALTSAGHDLEAALARMAMIVREDLEEQLHPETWRSVGASVRWSDLSTSGASRWAEGRPVIVLNASEGKDLPRQRFTAAHEVGHLLLSRSCHAQAQDLSYDEEERLCDVFATELLVVPEARRVMSRERSITPALLIDYSKAFRLSLQLTTHAVARERPDEPAIFLLAKWRGHPRRPEVKGFRVDAADGDRRVLVPKHKRITGMGLTELALWAADAPVWAEQSGSCRYAAFRATGTPAAKGQTSATGCVEWKGKLVGSAGQPLLLAVLDTGTLKFHHPVKRRSPGLKTPDPRSQLRLWTG